MSLKIKKYFYVIIFIFISIFNIFPKPNPLKNKDNLYQNRNKYLCPLSIGFHLSFDPNLFIYLPPCNYSKDFSFTSNIGFEIEYKMLNWFSLDTSVKIIPGFHYSETKYINNGVTPRSNNHLQFYIISIFFQYNLFFKFYLPFKHKFKNNRILKFFLYSGLTIDFWLFSYYFLFQNNKLINKGNFFDTKKDGPNQVGNYYDYNLLYNRINLGINLGIGLRLYNNNFISIIPFVNYTFFVIPMLDGNKNEINLTGQYDILLRNNGSDDRTILDFKMTLSIGASFLFDFGKEQDIGHF